MNTPSIGHFGLAIALFALLLSIVFILEVTNNDNTSPLAKSNTEGIITINQNIEQTNNETQSILEDMMSVDDLLGTKIDNLSATQNTEINKLQDKMNKLEARITQQEQATLTTNANQLDVPQQTTPKYTFNLKTIDVGGVQVSDYQINDVVYLSGDASVTTKPTLTIKIRSQTGTIIWDSDFSVQNQFTAIYAIPAGLTAGIYTITISDGNIVDSIKFNLK